MLCKPGKGIRISNLITPVEYRAIKANQIPRAQLKIGNNGGRRKVSVNDKHKWALVAHETMAQRPGEIGAWYQRQRVHRQGLGQLAIFGQRISHIGSPESLIVNRGPHGAPARLFWQSYSTETP